MAAPQQQMVVNDPMVMQAQTNSRGNSQTSIYVYQQLSQVVPPQTGWQSQMQTAERHGKTMNLLSSILLAMPGLDWTKAADFATTVEKKAFMEKPTKQQYEQELLAKTQEMTKKRQANAPNLQNQIQADAARQAQMQQQQQMMMMNQMAAARGMGHPGQPFQHLQRPMQAGQVPQQVQPFGIGMGNPGMLQAQANQHQFPMQMGQPPQPMPNGGLTPQDRARVMDVAQKLFMATPESQRQALRLKLNQLVPPQQIADYTASGKDPIMLFFQRQALQSLRSNPAMMQARPGMPGVPQPHPAQMVNPLQAGIVPEMGNFTQGLGGQQIPQAPVPPTTGPGRDPAQGPMMGFPQGTPGNPQGLVGQMGRPMPFNMQPGQLDPAAMARAQAHQAAQMRAQQQQHANRLAAQQAGALAGPPTTSQSPSMNTLNAPMQQPPVPMGQANPAMNPANPQAAPANTLNPQFNHTTNTRPQALMNPQFQAMMQSLGPEKVSGLPENKLKELMAKWQEQQRASALQAKQAQAAGMADHGQANNLNGPNQFGVSNPAQLSQQGQQPQQQPGVAMPPSSQPGMMVNQPMQQAQIANQIARMPPHAKTMMDTMDIPDAILRQLGPRMPPDTKKWNQLHQWQSNTQSLSPQMVEKLHAAQRNQFLAALQRNPAALNMKQQPGLQAQQLHQLQQQQQQAHLQAQQQARHQAQQQAVQQQAQQQVQQQQAQQQAMQNAIQKLPPQQGAQAQQPQPQLQQTPQQTPPQQPPQGLQQAVPQQQQQQQGAMAGKPNNALPPLPPHVKIPPAVLEVTEKDLQMLANNPRFKNVSPNFLPKLARKFKEDSFVRNYWNQFRAQRGNNAGMAGLGATPPTPNVAGPQAPQQAQPGPPTINNVQQNMPIQAPVTVKNAQNTNPSPAQQPAKNNLKRSSTDDLADAGQNGNFEQNQQPQNVENADKTQQAQTEAAMRNRPQQQAPNMPNANGNQEDFHRLQIIAREEHNRLQAQLANHPDIPVAPAELDQVRQKLSQAVFRLQSLTKATFKFFQITKNEEPARRYMRARSQLARQFKDSDKMTQQKDVLTISNADLDQIIAFLESFKGEMAVVFKTMQGSGQVPQPAPEGPAPLNAANLEKQAQILKQVQNRAGNKAAQPPPPPTTTQPPFAFGAKKSPAGGPTYLNKPTVTADNLHLPPPRKKTKTGVQQTSSPATQQATVPSPQTKPPSPELKRQPAPEPVKPEVKTYSCPVPDCESHQTSGFYSQEAANAHYEEEHVKPNADAFKFVNENLAFALGLDQQGNSKMVPDGSNQDSLAAPPMSLSLSKQGQTPMSKPEFAATPMSRDASMRRQGSSAGTPDRNGIKSENTPRLADGKLPGARQESETPQMQVADDPWAHSTIDPQNLFATFAPLETLPGSLASDMAMYRSLTPNDTPESSKDSGASEPNSDISEGMNLDIDLNWQPMDGDVLMHMASFNMEGFEPAEAEIMGEDNFQMSSFDDMNDFSKPFHFDTSLYSMDPS